MDDRSDALKWVTGGTDGRVKYWQLVTTEIPRSGKRPADIVSSMICLFSATRIEDTLPGRSEAVRRRQNGKPDDVILVRCAPDHGVVCGITEDGDLRVWFRAGSGKEKEVRIDAGSAEDMGVVKRMELEARDDSTASVLVHHYRSSSFTRFDIVIDADGLRSRVGISTRLSLAPFQRFKRAFDLRSLYPPLRLRRLYSRPLVPTRKQSNRPARTPLNHQPIPRLSAQITAGWSLPVTSME
jgi:hypothetical protein